MWSLQFANFFNSHLRPSIWILPGYKPDDFAHGWRPYLHEQQVGEWWSIFTDLKLKKVGVWKRGGKLQSLYYLNAL